MRWAIIIALAAGLIAGLVVFYAPRRTTPPARPQAQDPAEAQDAGGAKPGPSLTREQARAEPAPPDAPDSAEPGGPSREGDWPIFRGDPALRGLAAARLPENPQLLWKFKTGDAVSSSAVIAAGRVFVGSDDGNVYALSLATGRKLWSYKTRDRVEAPPMYLDGVVYVGSADGDLYALAAAGGTLKWKYHTGGQLLGSATPVPAAAPAPDPGAASRSSAASEPAAAPPVARGGAWILVGSYDNKLHCVDAATGKPVWTLQTDNYINGSPAVADGLVVFGGCDEHLHVVSVTTGAQVASFPVGGPVAGSPAVADGRAYLGHYNNAFLCVDVKSGDATSGCTASSATPEGKSGRSRPTARWTAARWSAATGWSSGPTTASSILSAWTAAGNSGPTKSAPPSPPARLSRPMNRARVWS